MTTKSRATANDTRPRPKCGAEAPPKSLWPTCTLPAGHKTQHETVSGFRWPADHCDAS